MAIGERELQWLLGPDPKMRGLSEWNMGYLRWSDYGNPDVNPFSAFHGDLVANAVNLRPFVTDDPPFSVDEAGNAFPAGTLWVVMQSGTNVGVVVRDVGNSSATITSPVMIGSGTLSTTRTYTFVYRAAGVPAGASATVTIRKAGGSVLSTLAVSGANGVNQTLVMPSFSGIRDDDIKVRVVWSGGVPAYEVMGSTPLNFAEFWAVPSTLGVGFTARADSDCDRGGSFQDCRHADWRRQTRPNVTYESYGLLVDDVFGLVDSLAGIPSINSSQVSGEGVALYNGWLGGALHAYSFLPISVNQATYSNSVTWPSNPDDGFHFPQPASFTSTSSLTGARASTLAIPGTDTHGTSAAFELFVDGVSVWSQTYSASDLMAGVSVAIGALTPATLGHLCSISLVVYTSGSFYEGDSIVATLTMSPRVDVPFPFSACGRSSAGAAITAPGGYVPAQRGTPSISPALVRLASGVTSAAAGVAAFLPSASHWYQVLVSSAAIAGIGEDEFGWRDTRTIARGHAGRPFYAMPADTATLTVYTPSATAIVSSGTELLVTTGNGWAWGSITHNVAGAYRVSVVCTTLDQVIRGVTAAWSLTDAEVLDPLGSASWESLDELYLSTASYAGETNTPPVSPSASDAWIVGTAPTGAWADHAAEIALWDGIAGAWRFLVPDAGSYVSDGVTWRWFDGLVWKFPVDPVIAFSVTKAKTDVLSLVLGVFGTDRDAGGTPDSRVSVSWTGPT